MKKQQKGLPNSVSQGLNATPFLHQLLSQWFTCTVLSRGKTCFQEQAPRDLDKGSVKVHRHSSSLCAINSSKMDLGESLIFFPFTKCP